ncbi:hypothetical protein [Streptomyces sp. NPDC051561]|uniref:hypothetical protein n=1 Tax=Streptomyces sp. NPDC051561 TaxID=3365658 RepID=UPI0037BA7F8D
MGAATATRASWAIPLLLGLTYGIYTAFMARGTSPLTARNVWLGVLCGVILTVVAYLVGKLGKGLPAGPHAAAFAAPFGIAMGFLYSLGGGSILTAVLLAMTLAASMFVASYYVFYSHSD